MTTAASPAPGLPGLRRRRYVTDGGMETDLIFHHGVDLPEFAAFPLLDSVEGRSRLELYYDDYAAIAAQAGAGLILEAPTWRANPRWGARLGYDAESLARVNRAAIALLERLRARYSLTVADVIISGMIGPRDDGYSAAQRLEPAEAAEYHAPQLEAFASAHADMAAAYTLADAGEAIGIVRAARAAGLPIAISFTVETDGRLPSGSTIADAIAAVDQAAPPDYYLINCAHPTHIARGWATTARGAAASRGSGPTRPPGATPSSTRPSSSTKAISARSWPPRPGWPEASGPLDPRRLLRDGSPARRRALGCPGR